MRNSALTHSRTTAPSVKTKNYDTAILVIAGLGLIGLAIAGYTLAVSSGIGRETIEALIFMP